MSSVLTGRRLNSDGTQSSRPPFFKGLTIIFSFSGGKDEEKDKEKQNRRGGPFVVVGHLPPYCRSSHSARMVKGKVYDESGGGDSIRPPRPTCINGTSVVLAVPLPASLVSRKECYSGHRRWVFSRSRTWASEVIALSH